MAFCKRIFRSPLSEDFEVEFLISRGNSFQSFPPCIEWTISQLAVYFACLYIYIYIQEMIVVFRMNESKNLVKSKYQRSVVLAYLIIQIQMLKAEV